MYELKKMIEQHHQESKAALSKNHRKKFQSKLNKSLHKKTLDRSLVFKVAASILVLISLIFYYNSDKQVIPQNTTSAAVDLNVISPELGKIETYYTTAINYELSNIPLENSNKELIDSYLLKLETLSSQYKVLSKKITTSEFDEVTVNNLINNLQLRLQLLLQLKEDLKQKNNNYENSIRKI